MCWHSTCHVHQCILYFWQTVPRLRKSRFVLHGSLCALQSCFTNSQQQFSKKYCSCHFSYGQQQQLARQAGSPELETALLAKANCQSHCSVAFCCQVSSTVGEQLDTDVSTACQTQHWRMQGAAECENNTVLMLVHSILWRSATIWLLAAECSWHRQCCEELEGERASHQKALDGAKGLPTST